MSIATILHIEKLPGMRSGLFTSPRLLRLGLSICLLASIIWLGGATLRAAAALSLSVSVLGLLFLPQIRSGQNLLSLMCAGLASFTLLQVCPLPLSVLEVVSPATAHYHLSTAETFGAPFPAWRPLSLSPVETMTESAKWASFSILASIGFTLGRKEGLQHFTFFLALLSTALACCFWAHQLMDAEKLFGIYRPQGFRAFSPIVNTNNLAGCLNLGTLAWLGLASSARVKIPSPLAFVFAFFGMATTLQTGSRAGAMSLALGVVGLLLLKRNGLQRSDSAKPFSKAFRTKIPTILLTLLVSTLLLFSLNGSLKRALFDADIEKFYDSIHLSRAIWDYLWLGTGKGGSVTISSYYLERNLLIFKYIESFPLSWCLEWGLPVGVLVLILLLTMLRPSALNIKSSSLALSLWLALCSLLLQNLFDIALEIYAPMALFITALGYLLGRRATMTGLSSLEKVLHKSSTLMVSMLFIGAVMGAIGLRGQPQLREREQGLFSQLKELQKKLPSEDSYAALLKELAVAAQEYPAERRFLILAAATELSQGRQRNLTSLRYLSEVLRRSPHFVQAHLLAAHALGQLDAQEQALLELKQAYLSEPERAPTISRHALKISQEIKKLQTMIPDGIQGVAMARALARAIPINQTKLKLQIYQQAQRAEPSNLVFNREYALFLSALYARLKSSCIEGTCSDELLPLEAEINALALLLSKDESCDAHQFRARIAADKLDYQTAIALTKGDCSSCTSPLACLTDRMNFADKGKNQAAQKETEAEYLSLLCRSPHPSSCVRAEMVIAQRAARRGAWLTASVHSTRAATIANEGKIWNSAANYSIKSGRLVEAQVALENARRLGTNVEKTEKLLIIAQQRALKLR